MTLFRTSEPVDVVADEYRVPPGQLDSNDRQPGGIADLVHGGKSVSQIIVVPPCGAGRAQETPTTGAARGKIPVAVLS
ncbi:MAG: hypothetical protein QOH17_1662 [Pseudonocardiales bacterium]|nr:hypothetical protein [Pseudonocardiales bacterium]